MNGSAALDLVMNRLGRRTNTELRAALILEMALVQEVQEGGPIKYWFQRALDTSLTTTANSELVTLPSNFLAFDEDWGAVYVMDPDSTYPDPYIKLQKDIYSDMQERFVNDDGSDSAQLPERWAPIGKNSSGSHQIALRAIPQDTFNLKILYYASDSAPTDAATTNLWLTNAADLLIAETGIVAAGQYVNDKSALAVFAEQAKRARERLWQRNEDLKHAELNYVMGEN